MARNQSIAAELMQKINLTKLRPTPAYLSISDGLSVHDFYQSEYARYYDVDISNIYKGRDFNDSHVFDAYSVFTHDKNSVKLRLDMLTFVAQNAERYKWDCYVYFKMHGILLDKWVNKMTYWGSRADELSLYALSDMLNCHTFVITGSKPWTTIHPSVIGTELELLDYCPVKLLHLGQYTFGKLVQKQKQLLPDSDPLSWMQAEPSACETQKDPTHSMTLSADHASVNQASSDVVERASQPILQLPTPYDELETAHTLADMTSQTYTAMELQHANPKPTPALSSLLINPPSDLEPGILTDAMEKITNHQDVSFSKEAHWIKNGDFADYMKPEARSEVTYNLKDCVVELTKLSPSTKLPVKLPTLQTPQDLLDIGAYFTRSKRLPKKIRSCRIPRTVSTNITYYEPDSSSDIEAKRKPNKKPSTVPPADGPSASRMLAQKSNTAEPKVRPVSIQIPPPDDTPHEAESDVTPNIPVPKAKQQKNDNDSESKGVLAVQSYTLKKVKKVRKYKCRICGEVCDSAHLLTVHHHSSHGILYCDQCTKAFNNPTSLERHRYQHKQLKFICKCGAKFAFESQLKTHSIVHRKTPEHHCVYPTCGKSFKNKGDLKRHAEEHTKPEHQCPDCNYSNKDVRNLESHRRQHNDIKPYQCVKCCEQFKYNSQYRRHIGGRTRIKCAGLLLKGSNSPEY